MSGQKRVVVTGMGGITALGDHWESIEARLRAGQNGVRRMSDWGRFEGLNTRLGAPVDFTPPPHYPRRMLRSMGRVSLLAVRASEMALTDAGLIGAPSIQSGAMGIAYGSSSGSIEPVEIMGR
ncbi:MAG TPA: beta-ketoacyl synthase N-terminal-like domain-containing protein, partial [Rhodocyclaceae bacterium]|nr:beta-ketoacyl synthase N-terminal-like domain-containing protein [Rhodocyclaceae bacterium]